MSINERYLSVRSRVRRLAYRDSFAVIWAYTQYLQIGDFEMPEGVEAIPEFLASDLPQAMLPEWALEQIAREVVMHADIAPRRPRTLRQWATLAEIVNLLRDLEDNIYADLVGGERIHLELMRIAHRQFGWRQQKPSWRWMIRYYKIFNTEEIDVLCENATGLSVDAIYLIGMALIGNFLGNPRTRQQLQIALPGVDQAKLDQFFRMTALPLYELRTKLRAEHALDEGFAYRYSSLRQFPLITISHGGQTEVACPVPTLLFWRITSGLYYELTGNDDFFNAFGRSFQDYVGDVLQKRITQDRFSVLDEAEYFVGRDRKDTVDFIVKDGDVAALFVECKTMRLTWASKAGTTDLGALERDIEKLANAVVQVYRTIEDYRAGHYPDLAYVADRAVYPAVVTLEDWYLFGPELHGRLDAATRQIMAERHIPVEWLDAMPFSVLSIDEFETASGIINQVGVAPFISGKVLDVERRSWAFAEYCRDRYRPEIAMLDRLFRDEYDAMFEELEAGLQ